VGFFGKGNPIAVGMALQLFHNARANFLARFSIRRSDDGRDWRGGQVVEHEFI
jgi:hypothetical protein